jgi:hypothetical protein
MRNCGLDLLTTGSFFADSSSCRQHVSCHGFKPLCPYTFLRFDVIASDMTPRDSHELQQSGNRCRPPRSPSPVFPGGDRVMVIG